MSMQKKRTGPAPVAPVSRGGVRYEPLVWGRERGLGQNGGYILACDVASGKELWTLKVYDVHYDPEMEQDKQDCFITRMSLAWFGNRLKVRNERGERFVVDLDKREVRVL